MTVNIWKGRDIRKLSLNDLLRAALKPVYDSDLAKARDAIGAEIDRRMEAAPDTTIYCAERPRIPENDVLTQTTCPLEDLGIAPPARPDANPKSEFGIRKPPISLVPPVAIIQESVVFGLGAAKYGAWNWRETSVSARVYLDAMQRHVLAWADGEDVDLESGASHLAHARACLAIILDATAIDKLIDDRAGVSGRASFTIAAMTKAAA